MSFNHKTIEELHDLLVSKEISATELTQATLEDIKAREEAVNAFVTVAEEAALAQAKAIDEKGIDADNLLSGIPLAVKDNISTDGILTTAASKMLYNYEPIFDATTARCLVDLLVVQQLLSLQVKSVCPLVQIQVVLSVNRLLLMGLLVSNQLMEQFPVLVSLPLVVHLTKLDLSLQPLRKMPSCSMLLPVKMPRIQHLHLFV